MTGAVTHTELSSLEPSDGRESPESGVQQSASRLELITLYWSLSVLTDTTLETGETTASHSFGLDLPSIISRTISFKR